MSKRPIKKRTRKKGPDKGLRGREYYNKRLKAVRVSPTVPDDGFLDDFDANGTEPKDYDTLAPQTAVVGAAAAAVPVPKQGMSVGKILGIGITVVMAIIGIIYFFTGFQDKLSTNTTNITNIQKNISDIKKQNKEESQALENRINNRMDRIDNDLDKIETKIDNLNQK